MAVYPKEFAILYVDDEEKSLEYFTKSFENEFKIFTASNVADAIEIIKNHLESIAVVITDQRMPKQTGVDLLKEVRQLNSNIVRMLTTAYTDLKEAIAAVNSGEIFRYITKPWELESLHGELISALSFFLVQQERNTLLGEKYNISYQILKVERLRDLVLMTANNITTDNKLQAINAFFNQITKLEPGIQYPRSKELETLDQSMVLKYEKDRFNQILNHVVNATNYIDNKAIENYEHNQLTNINQVCDAVLNSLNNKTMLVDLSFDLSLQQEHFRQCQVHNDLLSDLLKRLILFITAISKNSTNINIKSSLIKKVWNTAGIQLTIESSNTRFFNLDTESIINALPSRDLTTVNPQIDLLVCFYICFHLGGNITLTRKESKVTINLLIPNKPEEVDIPVLERTWLSALLQVDETGFADNKDIYSTKVILPTAANVKQISVNEYALRWVLPDGELMNIKGKDTQQVIQFASEAIQENIRMKKFHKEMSNVNFNLAINRAILIIGFAALLLYFIFS